MTPKERMMTDLEKLEETVAVYGANRRRWPGERAEELADICRSDEGMAFLAAAAALDRVLDRAGEAPANVGAGLIDKIMARTAERPRDRVRTPDVPVGLRMPDGAATRRWLAGGLLAASLLIGVVAGWNGVGAEAVGRFAAFDQTVGPDDAILADLSIGEAYEFEDDVL